MINKLSYNTSMTYDVSDVEKKDANRGLIAFKHSVNLADKASNHLNIIKTPFKDHPEMTSDEVMKVRAALRRFRDKAIENFNEFKEASFQCVKIMNKFSSDTQTVKLMKSFISSVEGLENKVNDFADLFEDLQSKDFPKDIVVNAEDIQKDCEEFKEIVTERIVPHIQENILAKTWVDSTGDNLNSKIENDVPILLELFNKTQDELNNMSKERSSL